MKPSDACRFYFYTASRLGAGGRNKKKYKKAGVLLAARTSLQIAERCFPSKREIMAEKRNRLLV